MTDELFNLVVAKYTQLNAILTDVITACEMQPCEKRSELVASIKARTNHSGIHYTTAQLYDIFLGSSALS